LYSWTHQNRNKSWKPECVLSFNMGICTLGHIRIEINHGSQNVFWVFEVSKSTNTHVKTQNTFWLSWFISILMCPRVQIPMLKLKTHSAHQNPNKSWKPECVLCFNMGICTLGHIRIQINHGSQNVFWVLTWVFVLLDTS
jgi:hypothetical protein